MSESPEAQADTADVTPKIVLVAVDFSEDSQAAVRWACRFSDPADTRLVLLHVVHDPVETPGFYRTKSSLELLPMQDIAETMMAEFLAALIEKDPELECLKSAETQLVAGLPPGRIVEVANQLGAEMIVIGSRGMTGLPHLMLGSVAERVVEMAHRPVVVVKAENQGEKKKKKKQKRKNKK
jgi:nucleotide-binding universal stress UspA family protein